MNVLTRRVFLSLAAGAVAVTAGCDMASLAYFLAPEQRLDAKMKHLASDDKKKEPRVVILSWAGLETRAEFIHADRQLSELLAQNLREMAQTNSEKLAFIPSRRVEEFKNNNPGWRGMDLSEVGRKFNADYVVYLEINSLSLYETGSLNQLLRGRTNITVSLVDVAKPDDAPSSESFSCVYPGDAPGPIPVSVDTQPLQFRQMFLTHVARQLARYFSKYPRNDRYRMDQPS